MTATEFGLRDAIVDRKLSLEHVRADELKARAQSAQAYGHFKRLVDIIVVVLAAPAVLTLILLAAALILVTMGRPIFFIQPRVGLGGRCFNMIKLRTMRAAGADRTRATLAGDPRITRLGALLRRTHIDELPQVWNILRGDMTLIGPRPEQPHLVETYRESLPHYDLRHSVRPGLSGWAQVSYGYAADLSETRQKLQFDLFYVKSFGPLIDLHIALRTVLVFMNKKYVR